jgi:alpha-tubulin suppressor-like RCC1 family protein
VQVADGDHDFAALENPGAPLVHAPITSGACPNSTVWTWGRDIFDDLGLGVSTTTESTPQEVTALNGLGVVQVVAASWHMFALTCTGRVYVWGSNESDDLGMGGVANQSAPVLNPYLTSLTKGSSAGVMLTTGSFGAGILVKGEAYGWGNNGQLECGCGTTANPVSFPTPVTQSLPFSYIDQGGDYPNNGHSLAVDAMGGAWCWGDNQQGQCGIGTSRDVGSPVLIPGVSRVTQVAAGGEHSMLLDSTGNVWTCGSNAYGQVGNGSSSQFTVVRVLGKISTISAGAQHSLAAD